MPLHLLGKKSWNVYNADNIALVKRDEAEHAAREEADEQHMQEVDAERRVKLLRGEPVSPPPSASCDELPKARGYEKRENGGHSRKRRRLRDEDDTERDLRYAQEDLGSKLSGKEVKALGKKSSDAPLMDTKGNINLFPVGVPKRGQKNAEAEVEKRKKEREFEDQYTMRFSNAAGFKQSIGEKPWYHKPSQQENGEETPGKDVWGNEDPRRREREKLRILNDDPMAIIKKGVAGVREVERERTMWREEKQRQIRELDEDHERERRRRRRKEGRHRHQHRHRSRSRSTCRHRSLSPEDRYRRVRRD